MQNIQKLPTVPFNQRIKSQNATKFSKDRSLLEQIASNPKLDGQVINQSGKLIISKLRDFFGNRCRYEVNCAHLRVQSSCYFLHQLKDFQLLGIPLPQKYLQNDQPPKKSKQERKQDKIRQKADRQKRLKQKQQIIEQKKQLENHQQLFLKTPRETLQEKVIDQKELLIQKILKPHQDQVLTLSHIYEQLNLVEDAICHGFENVYSKQFDVTDLKFWMYQIRKRLLLKFTKSKQFGSIQKQFVQKQASFAKKIIKNINITYQQNLQQLTRSQKWANIDLRQIQQPFTIEDIKRVLDSKKQHSAIKQYYSRFFFSQNGFPISFEVAQQDEEKVNVNSGNLFPLKNLQILSIISLNAAFKRLFISLNASFTCLRGLTEFASLMIPQEVIQKRFVKKIFCVDLNQVTYSNFVDQIIKQHLIDYCEKIKGLTKDFQFGKIDQNLQKYKNFLVKYKSKITSFNKDNSFILVLYNIKIFLEKIKSFGIQENLDYEKITKDRTFEEQYIYERLFLIKQFINIIGEKNSEKLKIIYITPGTKFKPKKFKKILSIIDKGLAEQNSQRQIQIKSQIQNKHQNPISIERE